MGSQVNVVFGEWLVDSIEPIWGEWRMFDDGIEREPPG
jgi:hypothetical protein